MHTIRNSRTAHRRLLFWLAAFTLGACSDQFSGLLFKSQYPHQHYAQHLRRAGLETTVLYRLWMEASLRSLDEPTAISLPHQEEAFIAGYRPGAIGYLFSAQQGERLQVVAEPKTKDSAQLFIDLFEEREDTAATHKHLVSADTGTTTLIWDIRKSGNYILRVQPELLTDISFRIALTAGPSLANPVASRKQHIGSFFGDARDGGGRQHEGIDIFAARHTPVVAAADGVVGRVGNNRLGGKVIWLRPQNRSVNLYYAHLDSQLVTFGQVVNEGDTLGLMGNTGNARTTPPHLHFGVYGSTGAVDPLPFVQSAKTVPPNISADTERIGDTMRTSRSMSSLAAGVPFRIEAAIKNGFRVVLPDGRRLVIPQQQMVSLANPLRTILLRRKKIVYAEPDTLSAHKMRLTEGEKVRVAGEYGEFLLIEGYGKRGGWMLR